MKTTIEISDELLKRAKATAALRGESLREFISHALEARLASTSRPPSPRSGWRSVFGLVELKTIEHIDKLLAEEFEYVDSTEWR